MVTTISYYWSPKSGVVAEATIPLMWYCVALIPTMVTIKWPGTLIPKVEFELPFENTVPTVAAPVVKNVTPPLKKWLLSAYWVSIMISCPSAAVCWKTKLNVIPAFGVGNE